MSFKLKITEIFYSLQGEGVRIGTPTIFIRLQGCSIKQACLKKGIICDTEFESGKEWSGADILKWINDNGNKCSEITWTGGEPTDQLTTEIIGFFKDYGFYQTIETNGVNPVPDGLDFVSVSPKVAEHIIKKNFNTVNELRYVRHEGQEIPEPSIKADHYWLSPHSDGFDINTDNLNHCIQLCKEHPQWKLSLQSHKVWGVL
jgi:organic radical activating enzyme|nr:radical SAM protein [Rhodospirillales bacterium]